jgi:hypothetical protein
MICPQILNATDIKFRNHVNEITVTDPELAMNLVSILVEKVRKNASKNALNAIQDINSR